MQDALYEQLLNTLLSPYRAWLQVLLVTEIPHTCSKVELFFFSEIFVSFLSGVVPTALIPEFSKFSVHVYIYIYMI